MKHHILNCADIICERRGPGEDQAGKSHIGHFILTRTGIFYLACDNLMHCLRYESMNRQFILETLQERGSLYIPLRRISAIRPENDKHPGHAFTISMKAGNGGIRRYTFLCAGFAGKDTQRFEAQAFNLIAARVNRHALLPPEHRELARPFDYSMTG